VTDPIIPEAYRGLRSFAFGDSLSGDELLRTLPQGRQDRHCRPRMTEPIDAGERWIVLDGRRDPRW